jgi:hypothetical protein
VVAAPETAPAEDRCALVTGLGRGYEALNGAPDDALADLLEQAPALVAETQGAQLEALLRADAFDPGPELSEEATLAWQDWAVAKGVIAASTGGFATDLAC